MSVFSKIISKEIPAYIIAEDERFIAFLDIAPLRRGHTLIVPKKEVDKVWDLPEMELQQLLLFAQPVAKAIERAFPCNRCGISVIGIEVPHAHMHLLPINNANDLNFTNPKLTFSEEEMKEAQQLIIDHLS